MSSWERVLILCVSGEIDDNEDENSDRQGSEDVQAGTLVSFQCPKPSFYFFHTDRKVVEE